MKMIIKTKLNKDEVFGCSIKKLKEYFADQNISIFLKRENTVLMNPMGAGKLSRKDHKTVVCRFSFLKYFSEKSDSILLFLPVLKKTDYSKELEQEFEEGILPYIYKRYKHFSCLSKETILGEYCKRYALIVELKNKKFIFYEKETI